MNTRKGTDDISDRKVSHNIVASVSCVEHGQGTIRGKTFRRKAVTLSSPVVLDLAQRTTRLSQGKYNTVAHINSETAVPELLGCLLLAEQSNPGF